MCRSEDKTANLRAGVPSPGVPSAAAALGWPRGSPAGVVVTKCYLNGPPFQRDESGGTYQMRLRSQEHIRRREAF